METLHYHSKEEGKYSPLISKTISKKLKGEVREDLSAEGKDLRIRGGRGTVRDDQKAI